MVGREVEGTKVVPLVFDFGTLGDRVTHPHEQVLEPLPGLGNHVAVAEAPTPVQLRQVQALLLQLLGPGLTLQCRPASDH